MGISSEKLDPYLDVFPRTLDRFYSLAWGAFGPHADYDGDGLRSGGAPHQGNDPDDTTWDTDGDGLSDLRELELTTLGVPCDPENGDTDGDGLSDYQEVLAGSSFLVSDKYRLGSNPNVADTDGDGLTDAQEVNGWLFQYAAGKSTWVTSDPARRDSDGDGLSDKIEYDLHQSDPAAYPYHPRVPNQGAFVGFDYQFDARSTYQGRAVIGTRQPVTYTMTLVNRIAPTFAFSGTLSLDVPPALQLTGGAGTMPFYLAGGERISNSVVLTATGAGSSGDELVLANEILIQLDPERVGAAWTWGTHQQYTTTTAGSEYPWATAVSPAPGWSTSFVLATIEGADPDPDLPSFARGRLRVYGLEDGVLGSPVSMGTDGTYVSAPDIACNTNGRCLVVWNQGLYSNVYGIMVDPGPTVAVSPFLISWDHPYAVGRDPVVATDGSDFVVAWSELDTLASVRSVSSAAVLGEISALDSSGSLLRFDLAWVGDKYLVVWQESTAGGKDVVAQYLARDGTPVPNSLLGVAQNSENDEYPQVAYDPNTGNALIAYRRDATVIEGRILDTGTSDLGAPFAIGSRGSDIQLGEPRVAFDPTDRHWVVAWADKDYQGVYTMRYQALAPDTSPRANRQYWTFGGSAPVNSQGVGLTCDGGCTFTSNTPPWLGLSRALFVDRVTLTSVPPPTVSFQSVTENVLVILDNDRPTSWVEYFIPGSDLVIQGGASDPSSGIAYVNVYRDDTGNWERATGRETWYYRWVIPLTEGQHSLSHYAVDEMGNRFGGVKNFYYNVDGTPQCRPAIRPSPLGNRVRPATTGRHRRQRHRQCRGGHYTTQQRLAESYDCRGQLVPGLRAARRRRRRCLAVRSERTVYGHYRCRRFCSGQRGQSEDNTGSSPGRQQVPSRGAGRQQVPSRGADHRSLTDAHDHRAAAPDRRYCRERAGDRWREKPGSGFLSRRYRRFARSVAGKLL
jgi:hypothetical protein